MQEDAIDKLGVEIVEMKWGQGVKDIGGEVKIKRLKKAQLLYQRGYVVIPNPTDPAFIKAFYAAHSKSLSVTLALVWSQKRGSHRVMLANLMFASIVFL